jgi:AcrR family transcriptional regulator
MTAGSLTAQLRIKRTELMRGELEAVALRLFDEHGFAKVTVDEIAHDAGISARTFYRYFPAKEDVLQLQIDQRTEALRAALAARPDDEAPLRSLRLALLDVVSAEDEQHLRRWTGIVAVTPSVLPGVIGGIQLKGHRLMAEFLAGRLGLEHESMVAVTLAAAAGGVIQAAHTQWFVRGGHLATRISDGMEVLEATLSPPPPGRAVPSGRS